MNQSFDDLRQFIRFLEDKKELVRVSREIDPILELNAIIDRLVRTNGPAVLFENVKGTGIPVLGNAFGTSQRISWSFGKENLIGYLETLIEDIAGLTDGDGLTFLTGLKSKGLKVKLQSLYNMVKKMEFKRMVKDGKRLMAMIPEKVDPKDAPCKEIILTGEDVDLNRFPFVKLWPEDGGKYLTLPLVITRDPENGTLNVGTYRIMMIDKNRMCMHWLPQKHGYMHCKKAEKLNQELPVAVVVGADPAFTVGGSLALLGNLDEFMVTGLLKGSPVQYTTAEDSDLWIPAGAEVVFEGVVKPFERADEGPFGEFHGYYSPVKQTPVFHVRKITMRQKPIFHVSTTGMPVTEIHVIAHEIAMITTTAMKKMIPGMVDLNMGLLISGFPYTAVISIRKTRPYEAHEIMHMLWSAAPQAAYITNIIVVDEEVNVNNLKHVARAISMNFRPDKDLMITPKGIADLEKPSTYPRGVGAKMGIDATAKWVEEGREKALFKKAEMPKDVLDAVEKRRLAFGFLN